MGASGLDAVKRFASPLPQAAGDFRGLPAAGGIPCGAGSAAAECALADKIRGLPARRAGYLAAGVPRKRNTRSQTRNE